MMIDESQWTCPNTQSVQGEGIEYILETYGNPTYSLKSNENSCVRESHIDNTHDTTVVTKMKEMKTDERKENINSSYCFDNYFTISNTSQHVSTANMANTRNNFTFLIKVTKEIVRNYIINRLSVQTTNIK
jgi:hypothetical protein